LSGFPQHLFGFFLSLGLFGPFLLGIVDALLFTPLANDVLVVSLVSSHHDRAWFYALTAAAGSVLGFFILDLITRKGGEAGLEKSVPPKRLERIKKRLTSNAGWFLALSAIMPPPFPLTAVVAGASALQYPRTKLLAIIAAARFVRFGLLAWLALRYGRYILKLAEARAVRYSVFALIVLSVAGSIWVIMSRFRKR
jgi:membrane protein YqaA with SNARE-associated domain